MKFFLFFLFLFTLSFANVYVDSSINELFEENDNVNVIVMFNQEDSKEMRISSDSKEMEIGMKIQSAISKTSIENEKVRELKLINGFSTELNQEDLEELKNNPNIEGIYYNYPVHIFLDESVPIINANDVWPMQYKGKNLTGQGQTVCVIDTGVDYTHPYLGGCTTQEFLDGDCEKVIGGYDFYNNDNNPIDDHGHGTHCAGIVASTHPIYKGVAPDAKIVAIKVFPSSGSTDLSYILEGIQWCVNHKSEYNISVISMSLGGETRYSSYCDVGNPYTSYINLAVAQNISVVVATGNDGSVIGISSPACIENSIRVGSSVKQDNALSSFSNRWNLDMVVAPGSNIYSTIPGGFDYKNGTSMATPHVAGVIALYNQYHYDRHGRYVSPSEIKQKLNDTGHIIYDSASGKNYARVDALELFNSLSLRILNASTINSYYNNSDSLYFEINLSKPVSNVYVNMTLPNQTNEIINLTNFTSTDYNGNYIIPNLHGVYSFVYMINDSGFIDYSENYNFTVLYDYICVNFTDCNYSIFEYEKVLLNNSLLLNSSEYFIFNNNTEFNCNNYEIYNSSYFEIIGENSSLNNCIFYGKEFEFNSTQLFNFSNILFINRSQISFNNSILNAGINSILLNEKVIANSINTTANYKINKSCEGLEIDILRLNKITNSTNDFTISNYFVTSCVNNSIEFNSSLNGSYTYNIFNLTVSNTTGGRTNTIYNYTYNFNISNNYLMNDLYNISFIISNNTLIYFDEFVYVNSSNFSNYIFNISSNVSGNHTLNYSICSTKLNRCLDSNFTIEVLDISSFNEVEIYPYVLSNNSNVTFNLNVSNHDSIWFNLTLPDGTNFIDFCVGEYNYTTNQIGKHNITFYANDTFNYIINYEDYFEVLELEESNLTFKDSKGNLTNITINLFYRNQNLFSDSFSNDSISVYELLYDLEINFSKIKLKLNQVNLTSKQFELILDELEHENYLLTNIINNTFNFSGNYTIEFNYSGLDYTNENYLELFKCSDWNFTNNTCNDVFEKRNFILNNISKTIIYSDNTFSAFSIAQSSPSNGDSGSGSSSSGGGSTGGSSASNVNISNCHFEAYSRGFYAYGSSNSDKIENIRIENSTFQNNWNNNLYLYYVKDSSFNNVSAKGIAHSGTSNSYSSMYSYYCDGLNITNSEFTSSRGSGLYLYGYSATPYGSNNLIENNTFNSNLYQGAVIYYNENLIFRNNEIKSNQYGLYLYKVRDSLIENNDIRSNRYHGMYLRDLNQLASTSTTIRGNFLISNGWGSTSYYGIRTEYSYRNYIYNNYFQNSGNRNIYVAQNGNTHYFNTTKDCSERNIVFGECIGGNYWNNYVGIDADADGIGDTYIFSIIQFI